MNVLVSEASSDAGMGSFGFFEFALVGVPLLAGTMAIIILFGQRLLPERNGATMPADFSRHAKTLVEQYGLASGIYQMRVRASSPYRHCPRQHRPVSLSGPAAGRYSGGRNRTPHPPLGHCRWRSSPGSR